MPASNFRADEVLYTLARATEPLGRLHVAQRTGMPQPTISKVVNGLLRQGLLSQGERIPSSGEGRPFAPLAFARNVVVLGVHVHPGGVVTSLHHLSGEPVADPALTVLSPAAAHPSIA